MPATVNSADGSCSAGTSEPEGSLRCPLLSKYSRNVLRISSEVIEFCSVGRASAARDGAPADHEIPVHQARQRPGRGALGVVLEAEGERAMAPRRGVVQHAGRQRPRAVAELDPVDPGAVAMPPGGAD